MCVCFSAPLMCAGQSNGFLSPVYRIEFPGLPLAVTINIMSRPATGSLSAFSSISTFRPVCSFPTFPVSALASSRPLCRSGLWPSALPFSELNQSHSMCILIPCVGARLSRPLCRSGVSHIVQSRDFVRSRQANRSEKAFYPFIFFLARLKPRRARIFSSLFSQPTQVTQHGRCHVYQRAHRDADAQRSRPHR
jgi:hypothetical protein